MCIPYRLFSLVLGAALTGCGGGLTFPDDRSSPDDGSPAALIVVSGDGQQGTVGSRLDNPLVVKLTDVNSQPITGSPVVFLFTDDVPGAEVDPAETNTNSDGLAWAEVRLGISTGPHQIEARVADPSAPPLKATFGVTAVARERGRGGGHGHDDDD